MLSVVAVRFWSITHGSDDVRVLAPASTTSTRIEGTGAADCLSAPITAALHHQGPAASEASAKREPDRASRAGVRVHGAMRRQCPAQFWRGLFAHVAPSIF